MRLSLAASALLLLGLFASITESLSPEEDWESSGLDLEFSGSGDGLEETLTDDSKGIASRTLAGGGNNDFSASSDPVYEPPVGESDFVILGSSKSVLENPEILAGVIAGGVTGLVMAVAIAAFLIYRWRGKEDNYMLGKLNDII